MRQVEVLGRSVTVQGSPMTLLYYDNEFGSDLYQDYVKTLSEKLLSPLRMLRLVWAMAKSFEPSGTPNFEKWLEGFPEGSFSLRDLGADGTWVSEVVSVVTDELFRDLATNGSACG